MHIHYQGEPIQVSCLESDKTTMKFEFEMEAIMFTLLVYYHDVLRYTIFGNAEKAQELRSQGFYVEVRPAPVRY